MEKTPFTMEKIEILRNILFDKRGNYRENKMIKLDKIFISEVLEVSERVAENELNRIHNDLLLLGYFDENDSETNKINT